MAKEGRVGPTAVVAGSVALVLTVACTGLPGSEQPSEGIAFRNRTGVALDYVYLASGVGDERTASEHRILRLEDGNSADVKPLPLRRNCTVAPVVARLQDDGTEIGRLPAGTCWDPLFVWELDEGDL